MDVSEKNSALNSGNEGGGGNGKGMLNIYTYIWNSAIIKDNRWRKRWQQQHQQITIVRQRAETTTITIREDAESILYT